MYSPRIFSDRCVRCSKLDVVVVRNWEANKTVGRWIISLFGDLWGQRRYSEWCWEISADHVEAEKRAGKFNSDKTSEWVREVETDEGENLKATVRELKATTQRDTGRRPTRRTYVL